MKKKVWDITVKDNPNRVVMGENDEFYTTDTEAYLVFNLDDKDFNPPSAVLTLENRNNGSLKNETVDVVDGLIEWEMPQRYIEHFGNWQGQLVYYKPKEDVPEDTPEEDKFETYTSAPFTFVVNAHIGDKKQPGLVEIENWEKFIRDGTELIETWEDMEDLRQANEAQRQANYQELLDTGVLQTNINTKLEALEEEYAPKLTDVTTQLAQTAKFQFQSDYVDTIKNLTAYDRARLRKRAGRIEVFADNGSRHVTFDLIKDTLDDFWKLSDFIIGDLTYPTNNVYSPTLTGSFIGLGASDSIYTGEIGATVYGEVDGDTITLFTYSDTRGGVWEVVIDGDTSNAIEVSTYRETAGNIEHEIASGLNPEIKHTVLLTYKGQDPNNPTPPSGNGRGWLKYDVGSTRIATIRGQNKSDTINRLDTYLSNVSSNKDFAFTMDAGAGPKWAPQHDTGGTVFNIDEPKVFLDGKEFDLDTLQSDDEMVDFTDFVYRQHCYIRHDGVDGNIAELWFTHHFDKTGVITVSGTIKALKDFTIDGYPIMLPLAQNNIKEIVTSIGNSKVSMGDNSSYFFEEEKDLAHSVAGVSQENPNLIVAATVGDAYKTMRINKGNKVLTESLRYWERPSSPKAYFKSFFSYPMTEGEIYSWSGSFAAAEIKDIYYHVKGV